MDIKAKHTPGPWIVGYGGTASDDYATITSKFATHPICQIEPIGYIQANAYLIASAPRLLESLQQTVASLEYWFTYYGDPEGANSAMMKDARAAINEATGRETVII